MLKKAFWNIMSSKISFYVFSVVECPPQKCVFLKVHKFLHIFKIVFCFLPLFGFDSVQIILYFFYITQNKCRTSTFFLKIPQVISSIIFVEKDKIIVGFDFRRAVALAKKSVCSRSGKKNSLHMDWGCFDMLWNPSSGFSVGAKGVKHIRSCRMLLSEH